MMVLDAPEDQCNGLREPGFVSTTVSMYVAAQNTALRSISYLQETWLLNTETDSSSSAC